jgi:hypothetical protein
MHSAREIRSRRLEQQVIVVSHQHIGVELPVESPDRAGQHAEEQLSIIVVTEDELTCVSTAGDVPKRACELEAQRPSHH